MDELRTRAYLDILLGIDSRPPGSRPDSPGAGGGADGDTGPEGGGSGPPGPDRPGSPAPAGPLAGMIPPGFAGKVNLTIPLVTVLGLADRPGEMAGIGPIDPALARDLTAAAARNPRTAWCITVTDPDGHAIGHGCARRGPKARRTDTGKLGKPEPPSTHDPPLQAGGSSGIIGTGGAGNRDGLPAETRTAGRSAGHDGRQVTFTAASQPGPPGGYGTWRLATGPPGQPDLIIALEPIPTGDCDHRHQARGHDPGVMLRHLAQVRNATCTGPGCRRPSTRADFEHNVPYEAGGRTCLCNGNPECRRDHRIKQDRRWMVEQLPADTSGGPRPPGGSTPPSRPGTRSDEGEGELVEQRQAAEAVEPE